MIDFPTQYRHTRNRRGGFTLVELLIVLAIITLLSSLALAALYSAQEKAKEDATRGLIQRLDTILMGRYDAYRYRPVDLSSGGVTNRVTGLQKLVSSRRELVRMELPDRITDLTNATGFNTSLASTPSGWFEMQKRLRVGQNVAPLNDPDGDAVAVDGDVSGRGMSVRDHFLDECGIRDRVGCVPSQEYRRCRQRRTPGNSRCLGHAHRVHPLGTGVHVTAAKSKCHAHDFHPRQGDERYVHGQRFAGRLGLHQ